MIGEEARRLLLQIAAISFTVAAVLGIATLLGGGGDDQDRIAYSAALISVLALIATPGAVLLDQRGHSALWSAVGGTALVASMLSLVIALLAIWTDLDGDEGIWVIVTVAITASHTSLLTIGRRASDPPSTSTLISLTIAAGVAVGLLVSLAVLNDFEGEGIGQAIAVFGILDALGLVLIPIARRLGDDGGPSPAGPAGLEQALGLERSAALEGGVWELDPARFDAVLGRAAALGIEPPAAVDTAGGRVALLRGGDSVVVLVTGRGPRPGPGPSVEPPSRP